MALINTSFVVSTTILKDKWKKKAFIDDMHKYACLLLIFVIKLCMNV